MASEELEQEAKELGIEFNPRIGDEKLQAKIDAFYESQETSGKEVMEAVQAKEATAQETEAEKPAVKGKTPIAARAAEAFARAKKVRIVTIIDNDQRVNNQTTTCKANWSNQFHDLGTKIFPLNIPIEVPQGFINVLKDAKIPHHVKDPKTGLSRSLLRNRYTINYETELEKKAGIQA